MNELLTQEPLSESQGSSKKVRLVDGPPLKISETVYRQVLTDMDEEIRRQQDPSDRTIRTPREIVANRHGLTVEVVGRILATEAARTKRLHHESTLEDRDDGQIPQDNEALGQFPLTSENPDEG